MGENVKTSASHEDYTLLCCHIHGIIPTADGACTYLSRLYTHIASGLQYQSAAPLPSSLLHAILGYFRACCNTSLAVRSGTDRPIALAVPGWRSESAEEDVVDTWCCK